MRTLPLFAFLLSGALNPLAAKTDNSAVLFIHPGILVDRAQLELIKQRVAAGTEPQ
jgi:hypothetical protein